MTLFVLPMLFETQIDLTYHVLPATVCSPFQDVYVICGNSYIERPISKHHELRLITKHAAQRTHHAI
jgi:hypothetical protein